MWPGPRPHAVELLPLTSADAQSVAKRWYDADVAPVTPWSFDAAPHLSGAAVGIAVWAW